MLRLCIIATLFTVIPVSCLKSKGPSPQYEVPTELISNLISENESNSPILEINLDENYKSLFSETFEGKKLFVISELNIDNQWKTLKERINFTYKPSQQSDEYLSYFNKYQNLLNNNIQLIEGVIVSSGDNLNDPSYTPDRLEFAVSLIKYTDPNDGQSQYYGAIELGNNDILLIYGNIIQVTKFNRIGSPHSALKTYNYQSIFTEEFNSFYQNKGLQIIMGSYMAQRILFRTNFNINLELNELIYQGAEYKIPDKDFQNMTTKERNTYFMSQVYEWSSNNLEGYTNKTFSMLYTNHPKLNQLVGANLGMSYINQTCENKYKSLWVKPFISGEKQGQYLVDAHEISHMLGAKHTSHSKVLMSSLLNVYSTQFDYTKQENIDAIFNSKNYVNNNGNCLNANLKRNKSQIVPPKTSNPELCEIQH